MTERLIFPFIDWMSYCWMPMRTAHRSKNPHLSATFGQFIFFKREAYEFMGGHKAISDNPLDDFELGRLAKKVGLKWKLLKGTNQVRVLAYQGNRAAFRAISRSIFPVFYYRTSVFAALSAVVLGLVFKLQKLAAMRLSFLVIWAAEFVCFSPSASAFELKFATLFTQTEKWAQRSLRLRA